MMLSLFRSGWGDKKNQEVTLGIWYAHIPHERHHLVAVVARDLTTGSGSQAQERGV
jgi:hypothetical protein